eukprot:c331_g1_i2.p1 GENE.c331_g1_i2~~c331_g1_i2.p1  ORF type:complete len:326 (+),score=77.06 c331_g1_i2:542-1519(+)
MIKEVGEWGNVVLRLKRGHYQPVLLLYRTANPAAHPTHTQQAEHARQIDVCYRNWATTRAQALIPCERCGALVPIGQLVEHELTHARSIDSIQTNALDNTNTDNHSSNISSKRDSLTKRMTGETFQIKAKGLVQKRVIDGNTLKPEKRDATVIFETDDCKSFTLHVFANQGHRQRTFNFQFVRQSASWEKPSLEMCDLTFKPKALAKLLIASFPQLQATYNFVPAPESNSGTSTNKQKPRQPGPTSTLATSSTTPLMPMATVDATPVSRILPQATFTATSSSSSLRNETMNQQQQILPGATASTTPRSSRNVPHVSLVPPAMKKN